MVPRIQMNKEESAVNGIVDDDAQPSTSTAIFGNIAYVRRIGAVLGITSNEITEKAIEEINNNVSYVLRSIISGSLRFAQHSRRAKILPEDVDAHLSLERKSAHYGFKPRELVALRLAGSGGREIFVEDDKVLELKSIYQGGPAKVPPIPSLKSHWLAIDGEQPAVPENPVPTKRENSVSNSDTINKDDDTQDEASRLLNIVRGQKAVENVNLRTTTTHTLSLEQQVYYKEITEAIMSNDDNKRTEALNSLKTDTGIQPLVGRFSLAVAEGVRCNIVQHNLAFLIYLMRLVQSLVHNPTVSLDKWLHEFLPSILSCILSRQVCTRPETDNHWALREFSGRLLTELCKKHQGTDIRSRVIKVLTKAWMDNTASMATIYGAIYTLDHFGPETIRSVVLPMIPTLYNRIQNILSDRNDPAERISADKLNNYTNKILVAYVRNMRPTNLTTYQDFVDILGGFADSVFRMASNDMTTARTTTTTVPGRVAVPVVRTVPPRPVNRAPTFVTQRTGNRVVSNGVQQPRFATNQTPRRPHPSQDGAPGPS